MLTQTVAIPDPFRQNRYKIIELKFLQQPHKIGNLILLQIKYRFSMRGETQSSEKISRGRQEKQAQPDLDLELAPHSTPDPGAHRYIEGVSSVDLSIYQPIPPRDYDVDGVVNKNGEGTMLFSGPVHTKTIVNANASKGIFYLRPHEDDHRLRNVFTRPHENARKRIKRCHKPNAHALSICACNLCFSALLSSVSVHVLKSPRAFVVNEREEK